MPPSSTKPRSWSTWKPRKTRRISRDLTPVKLLEEAPGRSALFYAFYASDGWPVSIRWYYEIRPAPHPSGLGLAGLRRASDTHQHHRTGGSQTAPSLTETNSGRTLAKKNVIPVSVG